VSEAVGVVHPSLITPDDVDILEGLSEHQSLRELYRYEPTWGRLGPRLEEEIVSLMAAEEISQQPPTRED
jgi:glutamate synthase (ferredoxin)